MSTTPKTEELSVRSWLARQDLTILLLSVAGGGVDAVIILGFHVLTAAQTGNTILLAVAFAQGRFSTVVYSAVSVVAYLTGSAVGEVAVLRRKSDSWLSPLRQGLLAELILLSGLLMACHVARPTPSPALIAVLVALAATAMGIQSAAVLQIHSSPTTTYVSGTLTTFATKAIRRLHLKAAPRSPARPDPSPRLLSMEGADIYGLDWLIYAGGALASALLFLRVHETALVLPIAAVVTAAVAGVRQIDREEKKQ